MSKRVAVRSAAPSPPASSLLTGLVSYWPLSEASGARADEVGGHHLSDNNSVLTDTGKLSALAAHFNRDDDPARYLSVAMHDDFNFNGQQPFTIAAWFKLDSQYSLEIPYYSYIVAGNAGAGAGSGWNFFVSGSTIVLYLGNGSTNTVCHAPGVNLGQWQLGFGWYDPDTNTNNGLVYGNSIDSVEDLTGPAANAAPDLIFGCQAKTLGYRPWDGEFGPVMLWSRVLTSDERAELWNSGNGIAYPF